MMPKYFDTIMDRKNLNYNLGAGFVAPFEFKILSSNILSQCTFLQNLIQQIIYTSHGAQIVDAKMTLKDFPNPKARLDFLCSFPYSEHDPIVEKVFNFARLIFIEIYELRNVLAHETWSSSEEYPDAVLFSSLDENSRLEMASGRLWHNSETTSQNIYDALIRFIRNVKIVKLTHLESAIHNAEVCSWALMHIRNILNEDDNQRKEEARQAFLIFRGTSHLFGDAPAASEVVEFSASKSKMITGT